MDKTSSVLDHLLVWGSAALLAVWAGAGEAPGYMQYTCCRTMRSRVRHWQVYSWMEADGKTGKMVLNYLYCSNCLFFRNSMGNCVLLVLCCQAR